MKGQTFRQEQDQKHRNDDRCNSPMSHNEPIVQEVIVFATQIFRDQADQQILPHSQHINTQ